MTKYVFKLYVKGSSVLSGPAIEVLTGICRSLPEDEVDFSVIDLDQNFKLSETDRILVAPTLLIISPSPVRRIIAGLSNREEVCSYIGITENNAE